jgi:hypothetical protein
MTTSCSRRAALRGALGAAALALTPAAQAKVAQQAAGYQDKPQDGQQCSGCAHFHAPATCDIVDGTVSPSGWCKLFTKKQD